MDWTKDSQKLVADDMIRCPSCYSWHANDYICNVRFHDLAIAEAKSKRIVADRDKSIAEPPLKGFSVWSVSSGKDDPHYATYRGANGETHTIVKNKTTRQKQYEYLTGKVLREPKRFTCKYPPSDPVPGDVWVSYTEHGVFVYLNSRWEQVTVHETQVEYYAELLERLRADALRALRDKLAANEAAIARKELEVKRLAQQDKERLAMEKRRMELNMAARRQRQEEADKEHELNLVRIAFANLPARRTRFWKDWF